MRKESKKINKNQRKLRKKPITDPVQWPWWRSGVSGNLQAPIMVPINSEKLHDAKGASHSLCRGRRWPESTFPSYRSPVREIQDPLWIIPAV